MRGNVINTLLQVFRRTFLYTHLVCRILTYRSTYPNQASKLWANIIRVNQKFVYWIPGYNMLSWSQQDSNYVRNGVDWLQRFINFDCSCKFRRNTSKFSRKGRNVTHFIVFNRNPKQQTLFCSVLSRNQYSPTSLHTSVRVVGGLVDSFVRGNPTLTGSFSWWGERGSEYY